MWYVVVAKHNYFDILSVTSVAAMHTCDCSQTTIGNVNIIDRYWPENSNPRNSTIEVEYGGTADYTTADIRDTMSIACGDGLGYNYCGTRQLQFINITSGTAEISLVSSYFNSENTTIKTQSLYESEVGVHTFSVWVKFDSITLQAPSQGLLNSTNFQVTVVHPCRNTTMDNVTITDDLLFKFTNQTKEVIKINVGIPNDTMSWSYGNKNGSSFCGDRKFVLQNQTTGYIF